MIGPWFAWRWPDGGSPSVLIDAGTREEVGRLFPEVLSVSEDADWFPCGISSSDEMEADPSLRAALLVYIDAEAEWLTTESQVLRDEIRRREEDG